MTNRPLKQGAGAKNKQKLTLNLAVRETELRLKVYVLHIAINRAPFMV